MTADKQGIGSALDIAAQIKRAIKDELNLTSSAGVSINKFVAKIASEIQKPDGLTFIGPSKIESFMENLRVEKFFGVGKVTAAKMKGMDMHTGSDLKKCSRDELVKLFGKNGHFYYGIVRGIDERRVEPNRVDGGHCTGRVQDALKVNGQEVGNSDGTDVAVGRQPFQRPPRFEVDVGFGGRAGLVQGAAIPGLVALDRGGVDAAVPRCQGVRHGGLRRCAGHLEGDEAKPGLLHDTVEGEDVRAFRLRRILGFGGRRGGSVAAGGRRAEGSALLPAAVRGGEGHDGQAQHRQSGAGPDS